MPGRNETWNLSIALAGIIATAVVGLAATGVTFFVAQEDRDNTRALARQSLVYDRRSQAYVDALVSLQGLSTDARLRRYDRIATGWPEFQADQAPLRARVTAFGSIRALRLYNTMYFAASRFVSEALAANIHRADEAEKQAFWAKNASRQAFDKALREFEEVVRTEVG